MKKFVFFLGTFLLLALTFIPSLSAQTKGVPTLDVLTPSEGQTIYGDKVPVLLDAQNFQIVDFANNTKTVSGQGHVHLWLDDEQMTAQSAAKAIEDTFTFSDVPAGDHKLRVELVNNDHTSLKPPVVVEVTSFKTAPVASAVPPEAESGFDKKTALVIFVVVALVIIAAWWYTKDEDEEMEKESKVSKVTKGTKSKVTRKKTTRSRKK